MKNRTLKAAILLFILCYCSQLFSEQVKPIKLEIPHLNTNQADMNAVFSKDGNTLLFNSKRASRFQDIYISKKRNGVWGRPKAFNEINSVYNDESPFLSEDGQTLLFSSDRDGSTEIAKNAKGQVKVTFDIYWSKLKDGKWSKPERVPGFVNTKANEKNPSLSSDGKTLYYTVRAFGDQKNSWIVKAQLVNGRFTNRQPMPKVINANYGEKGFYPVKGGFYFSSSRPGGYGQHDVYFVSYTNGKYGEAKNLGPLVNSKYQDIGYFQLKNYQIVSSNRNYLKKKTDPQDFDILSLQKEQLKILVVEKDSMKPLQAKLEILPLDSKKYQMQTNALGLADLNYESIEFLSVISKGYLPAQFKQLKFKKNIFVVELKPMEEKTSFTTHAINFAFDSAEIEKRSLPYLSSLTQFLKTNPTIKIKIIGHTDLNGGQAYNQKLSLTRAESVKEYLISKGITSDRLTTSGAGKSSPMVAKVGKSYDRLNRRTEFVITK